MLELIIILSLASIGGGVYAHIEIRKLKKQIDSLHSIKPVETTVVVEQSEIAVKAGNFGHNLWSRLYGVK